MWSRARKYESWPPHDTIKITDIHWCAIHCTCGPMICACHPRGRYNGTKGIITRSKTRPTKMPLRRKENPKIPYKPNTARITQRLTLIIGLLIRRTQKSGFRRHL